HQLRLLRGRDQRRGEVQGDRAQRGHLRPHRRRLADREPGHQPADDARDGGVRGMTTTTVSSTEDDKRVVTEYLDAVGSLAVDDIAPLFHDDGRLLLPYAPAGVPQEVAG